jgi:hypothetical protein
VGATIEIENGSFRIFAEATSTALMGNALDGDAFAEIERTGQNAIATIN